MEVVDDSHGHLGDQRVPPSTGSVPFHHDGSLDSAYEENFECGEEAIQRRLLITRILSSPLLFCASASSSPDAPTLISSCSGVDAHSSVSFSSDEDTEDTTNTLEVSRAETEEYELGSSPLKRASLENEEQVEDLIEKPANNNNNHSDEDIWNNISSNCDNYNNKNAVKIDLTHQKAIHGIRRSQVARVIQEIVDRIVVINETITTESPTIDTECDDDCLESDIPCLSWRNRRPMSGRSISTDSGISSVDDSRLSHTSSDYAASPAAVSDTSDEVRTQEKKTRRRSARLEAEPPAPKQLRTSSNALRSCATPKSTSPSSKITNIRSSSPISSSSSKKGCPIQNTHSVTALNVQTTAGYLQTRSSLSSKPSSHTSVESAKNVACRWKDCLFVAAKDNDLADHIADAHVEPQGEKASFVCLWESCKVFNVPSTLKHWLEQHVVKHSRSKPLKCIVDGCPQRFSTKPLLQAHVNSHFEKNPKLKNESALKNQQLLKLAKRKRLLRQNSKMQAGRKYDFFDAFIMHQIKERLLQSAERTPDHQMPPSSTSPSSSAATTASNDEMKSSSIMTRSCSNTSSSSSCPLNSAGASEPLRNRRKRSSSRRIVALTNELNDEVMASSPDSGCSSLRETDGVQTLVRAIRELPSGQRQMLISYYKPHNTELISVVEPPDHS